jgi:hypothetical protein
MLKLEDELTALARRALSTAGSIGGALSLSSGISDIPPRSSRKNTPFTSRSLQQEAFQIARHALSSAGSMGASSTFTDDIAPAFLRYQEQQESISTSPYHAPAFKIHITPTKVDSNDFTIRRPVSYGQNPAETLTSIDRRLTIGNPSYRIDRSKSSNFKAKSSSPRYSHVPGGAFSMSEARGDSVAAAAAATFVVGPSDYGDTSIRAINGGTISQSKTPSNLDLAMKRSRSLPGPVSYDVMSLTRQGGTTVVHTNAFSKAPARSDKNSLARRRQHRKFPYTSTPGPGFYNNVDRPSRLTHGVAKFVGKAGDRFTMKGDELLNFEEMTYVDIQHVEEEPMEWRLRTGHCWDVSERNTMLTTASSLPSNIGPSSYPAELDGAVGRNGRYQQAGKKSMPFATFHRPNQQKSTKRRPLHIGIFERLAKTEQERAQRVESAQNALHRVAKKVKQDKKKKQRKKRRRMAQRSGAMRRMTPTSPLKEHFRFSSN